MSSLALYFAIGMNFGACAVNMFCALRTRRLGHRLEQDAQHAYAKAMEQATHNLLSSPPAGWPSWGAYWLAWFAARMTACALLDAARQAGVTDAQWQAMREVAAEVAED